MSCCATTCAGAQELGRGWSGLAHPSRTLRRARKPGRRGGRSSPSKPAPRTSLNHPVGADRRLAIVRGRLDLTKQIAHAHHAKVNDVVLAAVAGGLRQLLASRGEDVEGLLQRAMVTISEHQEQPGQARGNKPGWMMVPLPLGEPDPVRRLGADRRRDGRAQAQARPEAGSGIFRFVAAQRVWYRLFPAAAVGEPGRDQRPGSAGAAVSRRRAAAGGVPHDADHGQPDARRRRAVLRRAAQPHRGRRPGRLPGRGGVRPGRA